MIDDTHEEIGAGPHGSDGLPDAIAVAWGLLDLPGAVTAASYLTSTNAVQYRLIVDVMADQQRHQLTGVAHDELCALICERLDEARPCQDLGAKVPLESRMQQLVAWGTCEAWQDQVDTEADFLRNRTRYQLTELGAELNRVIRAVEAGQGSGSTAALLAPKLLADRLTNAVEGLALRNVQVVSEELSQVQSTLETMARTAAQWQSRLAAALGGTPTEEKVSRLLHTVIAYVDMWGAGVDVFSDKINDCALRLLEHDPDTWRSLALARVGSSADEEMVQATVSELHSAITTLTVWFGGDAPQARRLRRQMRDAVAPLVRGHRTLLAVGGAVSRRADMLRLARAIEATPSEDEARRLWGTATGLYAARHVGITAPPPERPFADSVWSDPPAPISQRLRQQGPRSLARRAASLPDTSRARQRAKEEAARLRAEFAQAEASLAARSGTRLSTWGRLSRGEAEILLDMIATARATPRLADGSNRGISADGRWSMLLIPTCPGASAVIAMPGGRLVLEDAQVVIRR